MAAIIAARHKNNKPQTNSQKDDNEAARQMRLAAMAPASSRYKVMSAKELVRVAARKRGAPVIDDWGRIQIEPFELTRWFMVKQQFMTEKLLADRKLKKKGITSKGLGVPKAKKDLHGPIKVGDVCVLHVGHQTGGPEKFEYVTAVSRRVEWGKGRCSSDLAKKEFFKVRRSMVKADELDVEMDPKTLAKAGGVDGDLLTDVPGDYLNWVDPADGFQHYFNSNELKKRAAAVASAATMMADMRNRGELRPEGTTDGVSGKPVKRKPGDERDESHGAFIFECFTLLDADDDELLTIDEMKRWVQVICPGVEVTDEFLKDLLITVGKEDTPEYEGGPSAWATYAFTWFEFQLLTLDFYVVLGPEYMGQIYAGLLSESSGNPTGSGALIAVPDAAAPTESLTADLQKMAEPEPEPEPEVAAPGDVSNFSSIEGIPT